MKGPRGNNAESCSVPFRRALLAALVLALGFPVVARAASGNKPQVCTDSTDNVHAVPTSIARVSGLYALPDESPRGLVVFFHGYGHGAEDWAEHLVRVADVNDVIAVAMDYPGTTDEATWQVQEGADASNTVAQWFEARCDPGTVVAYGVSMGGNASGLALARKPLDAKGDFLYDWWFDIEGANNVIETYQEARALAPVNAFAAEAAHGIEVEMGGTFEEKAAVYADHTNVLRITDIAASGIKGVVMVHALDDGLVPYNQSREMRAALLASGKPVQFWTVGTCESGCERDTTIDGYANDYAPHDKVLAGHSNESDYLSLVGNTGFDRLDALFDGIRPEMSGEFVRDERTDTYTKP